MKSTGQKKSLRVSVEGSTPLPVLPLRPILINLSLWTAVGLGAVLWRESCSYGDYDLLSSAQKQCLMLKSRPEQCSTLLSSNYFGQCLHPRTVAAIAPRSWGKLVANVGPAWLWIPLLLGLLWRQGHWQSRKSETRVREAGGSAEQKTPAADFLLWSGSSTSPLLHRLQGQAYAAVLLVSFLFFLAGITVIRWGKHLLPEGFDPSGHVFVYGLLLAPLWVLGALSSQHAQQVKERGHDMQKGQEVYPKQQQPEAGDDTEGAVVQSKKHEGGGQSQASSGMQVSSSSLGGSSAQRRVSGTRKGDGQLDAAASASSAPSVSLSSQQEGGARREKPHAARVGMQRFPSDRLLLSGQLLLQLVLAGMTVTTVAFFHSWQEVLVSWTITLLQLWSCWHVGRRALKEVSEAMALHGGVAEGQVQVRRTEQGQTLQHFKLPILQRLYSFYLPLAVCLWLISLGMVLHRATSPAPAGVTAAAAVPVGGAAELKGSNYLFLQQVQGLLPLQLIYDAAVLAGAVVLGKLL